MAEVCAAPVAFEDDGPCQQCGQPYYPHRDHNHIGLTASEGMCPFRDCGNYQPPVKAICGHPYERGSVHIEGPLSSSYCSACHEWNWETNRETSERRKYHHAYAPGTTCPTCGGEGMIEGAHFIDKEKRHAAAWGRIHCPTCHGLRVVPLEVTSA